MNSPGALRHLPYRVVGLLLVAWQLCYSATAAAQLPLFADDFFPPKWDLEIRIGEYRPWLVDSASLLPYRQLMYDNQQNTWFAKHPIMFGGQAAGYIFAPVGLLGVYGGLHYWSQSVPGRACFDGNGQNIACTATTVYQSVDGTDTQTLSILPLSLGIIYRYDDLRRYFQIPLVISIRGGLDYSFWWASLGASTATTASGQATKGGILGISGALQLAAGIDHFKNYGTRSGVQDGYVFVEVCSRYGGSKLLPPSGALRLDFSDPIGAVIGLMFAFH